MATHVQPPSERPTSPPHHPSSKTPRERRRPVSTASYPPVATASSYYDPYGGSPAIVYGGTGAPPLVASPGLSTPQYYTTSAMRPPDVVPAWGPPMYINGQGPYYTSSAPHTRSSRHRHSPSPPPQVASPWGVPVPAGNRYGYSEPARPWPPPTVYYQPPIQSHPPPQRPPSAPRSSRSSQPLSRPKTTSSDPEGVDNLISKWAVGEHYGTVLDPFIASIVRPEFLINPMLLLRPVEGVNNTAIIWNIVYPGSYARIPDDPSGESWFQERVEPATFPRMSSIRVISRTFPWIIEIKAEANGIAVTCRDVVDQLHKYLCVLLGPIEMDDVTPDHRKAMSVAFRANRSQDIPAEIFRDSIGMRRMDWLCKNTMFEGLEEDKGYITERLSVFVPGTFVLRCGVSMSMKAPMTQRRLINTRISKTTAGLPDSR